MKRYLFYSISTLLLIGCSLDEEPKDQIPEDEAYTTVESLYQNTVATLYNYIGGNTDGQGLQGTCRGVYDLQTFGSDEAMLPTRGIDWYDGGLWQAMYKHSWNPGHELLGNSWKYLYKVITLCNNSLEKLEEHEELAGEYLIQWQAEVRALRAIFYWYLIDLFGDVPLVVSTTVSMNDVQSSERAAVFDFIVGELESTLHDLPPVNSVEHGIFYGHITQPVSLFVLAKLMLNAPVYTGRTSNKYYISCIEYCDEIEHCGFQLEGFYDNNFESNNERSRENIFVIPMDKNLYSNQQQNIYRSLHYRHAAGLGFTGENGTCATRRTLEIFGYFDEVPDIRFYHNFYSDYLVDTDGDFITDRTGKVLKYVPTQIFVWNACFLFITDCFRIYPELSGRERWILHFCSPITSVLFLLKLLIIKHLHEEDIRHLFKNCNGISDTSHKECVPNLVNLVFYLTCYHIIIYFLAKLFIYCAVYLHRL